MLPTFWLRRTYRVDCHRAALLRQEGKAQHVYQPVLSQ